MTDLSQELLLIQPLGTARKLTHEGQQLLRILGIILLEINDQGPDLVALGQDGFIELVRLGLLLTG